jgi:hypothetical protein
MRQWQQRRARRGGAPLNAAAAAASAAGLLLLLLAAAAPTAARAEASTEEASATLLLQQLGYDPVAARQEHGAYLGCFNGTRLWDAGVLLDWAQLGGGGGGWGADPSSGSGSGSGTVSLWPLPASAASRCPDACKRAGYPVYAISRGYECACLGQAPAGGARLSDGACDAAAPVAAAPGAAAPHANNATAAAARKSRETLALFYLHDADAARVALITPDMPGGGADASTGAACRIADLPLLLPRTPDPQLEEGEGAKKKAAFDVAYNPAHVVWGGDKASLEQLAGTRMRPASRGGQSTAVTLRVEADSGGGGGGGGADSSSTGTRLDGAEPVAFGLHSWRARVSADPGVVTSWYLRSDKTVADGDVDEASFGGFFLSFFPRIFLGFFFCRCGPGVPLNSLFPPPPPTHTTYRSASP